MSSPARYGFLGPRGTFAEAALLALPEGGQAAETVPYADVASALAAARSGEVAGALVPLENSVEGVVPATVDDLAAGEPLVIVAEMALPVRFVLLTRAGTDLAAVRQVSSHPHALAQCRNWLAAQLPDAELVPTGSTAGAAAALAAAPAGSGAGAAAIASQVAATAYGLHVLAEDIGDTDAAWTRFVLVAPPGAVPAPTGADKTSLCLFMHEDHPGALLEILTEFAVRGVNLTRIESRPTKRALGDYYFSVDFEGHVGEARVGEALTGLHRICADVRFLGSYARHDGKSALLRPGVSDADFAEAATWLAKVRNPPLR